MRRTAIYIMVLLLIAGVAWAKEYKANKKTGDLNVNIIIDKNPPIIGKNNLEITITDSSGKAVTDAKVAMELSMPAMPGMAAMNYKYNAELKGNVYKAIIEPSMVSSWNLAIKISRAGKTDTVKLTLDVQ